MDKKLRFDFPITQKTTSATPLREWRSYNKSGKRGLGLLDKLTLSDFRFFTNEFT